MDEVDLSIVAFWVRVHNLPPDFFTTANAMLIGSKLGRSLEFEDFVFEGIMLHPFLWLCVLIPVDKPLKLGFWLPRNDIDQCWVRFRYEKLQLFCYRCDILVHELRECSAPRVWNSSTP